MSEFGDNRDNFCYRHPDRQSFILCQRCGRTVCPACATQAAVGVHCPECIHEGRANAARRPPVNIRVARSLRAASGQPVVTYAILGLMVLAFLGFLVVPAIIAPLAFAPVWATYFPWTALTYALVHTKILGLLFDLLILFFIGRQAEQSLGRARYLSHFLLATLGGAVAMLVFVPEGLLIGPGPAIWGFFGAIIVLARSQGANITGLLIMLGLLIVLGIVIGSPWQASLGGLVVGAALTWVNQRFGAIRQARQRTLATVGIAAGLVVIGVAAILA